MGLDSDLENLVYNEYVLSRIAFECSFTVSATNVSFLPKGGKKWIIQFTWKMRILLRALYQFLKWYILKISNLVSIITPTFLHKWEIWVYFAPTSSHLCILTFAFKLHWHGNLVNSFNSIKGMVDNFRYLQSFWESFSAWAPGGYAL